MSLLNCVICCRQDQIIQEVYLKALKTRVGEINPEYFMTDDDGKYFNAWTKEMGNSPRRLICSWHVVKNWNIQGRAKIKDQEIRKTMKSDMHKIMAATDRATFERLYQEYFEKLRKAGETQFLNYLNK